MRLQVDQRTESVLLPIYGIMVPFHILTIKNATNNQDGDHAYIRINFNFGTSYEPTAKFPNALFLKELSFRSSDAKRASKVCFPLLAMFKFCKFFINYGKKPCVCISCRQALLIIA